MLFSNDIPHLKVYKQRTYLPIDKKLPQLNNMVIINSNDIRTSEDVINSKLLFSNNKYHLYYIDPIYKGKVFKKQYNLNYRKNREERYEIIDKNNRFINCIALPSALKNRNFYYDIEEYNNIFFDKGKNIRYDLKIKEYLKYIKSIINNTEFSNYNKIMVINVDDWMVSIKTTSLSKINFDNPVSILYYSLLRFFDEFKELGDINILFEGSNGIVRLNPNQCDERTSAALLKRELLKINSRLILSDKAEDVDTITKETEKIVNVNKDLMNKFGFTGVSSDEVQSEASDVIDKKIEEIVEIEPSISKNDLESQLSNDINLSKELSDIVNSKKVGKTTASIKRDQVLRERQKELKLENMTIEDYTNIETKKLFLEKNDVSAKVQTTNRNITDIKYPSFEKSYNENLMKKDLMNIISDLNDKSIPIYIKSIDVEDTSDNLNYKETYTIQLEDANRVRHTLKFDMPKFIDDKFMYLNGNKKIIIKQQFNKPVVKTSSDVVQITTNYRKVRINRYGDKVSSKLERFKKVLSTNPSGIEIKLGNATTANKGCITTMEYGNLAKNFLSIKVGGKKFIFNQEEARKIVSDNKIKLEKNEILIGIDIKTKDPIIINTDTQLVGEKDIVDCILELASEDVKKQFSETKAGKKYVYSRAYIMNKHIPLILVLGYFEGLTAVLRKGEIKHYFSDKRPKPESDEEVIQFANGYLVYKKYPVENSILLNGLREAPTKAFNYEDFDIKDTYLDILEAKYGSRNIGNAFDNFYECLLDPITKEVLKDLDYPTDLVKLFIFSNSVLADDAYLKENNMNLYRIRSNEVVNAMLYQAISDAYCKYRATSNNNNPVKISIPRNTVLKSILMSQTIEDYSTLNPIVELEKSRAITPKGLSGLNLASAYTQDKRSYDKSMLGLLAVSTSPDANCGVVRELTLEPNIVGPRGYIDINDDDLDNLKDANLFSPAEMLSPLGVTCDDTIRTAMATKQSKHIIPVEKSSPVLISNGVEEVMQYHLSNDFIVTAKQDGVLQEINTDAGLAVVKYKDGTHQAIDITSKVVKNGAGGFFLSNKLELHFKAGDKIKKNDIIASHSKFFTNNKIQGNKFNIGSLQKLAVYSSYASYEDSAFVTHKMAKEMASEIVLEKPVTLGKNSNVDYIVKVGDKVQVGDELIRFEQSFEEDSLNSFLSSVGDDLKEEIKTLGKQPIKSKYTGTIEDIKIYSTVDLEELSPSLKKLVSEYYNKTNKRKKVIDKYDKSESVYRCGILFNESTSKIETTDGKVKGNQVGEGVLIEFYIKYLDILDVGDKITYFTALKSTIGLTIPEGLEPFSEFRPNEEVSTTLAPSSILQRMTPSILITMFGNKVLVETKRKLWEIYNNKDFNDEQKKNKDSAI